MAGSGFQAMLQLGSLATEPAPAALMSALDTIVVTQSDQCPSACQLSFTAERTPSDGGDFAVVANPLLNIGGRIIVSVSVLGNPSVVFDGFITHQELAPPTSTQPGSFTVTAEDVSVAMDLYEYSLEYPEMPDSVIALTVLGKWAALGIWPDVRPSITSALTFLSVPQQMGTDRNYMRQLAANNGNIFCIIPGPGIGQNRAYWGPPPLNDPAQAVLTIDSGPAATVESIRFSYDGLAPSFAYGTVEVDALEGAPVPVMTVASTRPAQLATRPALTSNGLFARHVLFDHYGLDLVRSTITAQALTDSSTDQVVTAQGTLDALRYGGVLVAPGVVPLRGAGLTYDGLYYVKQVQHTIGRGGYKQDFVLTREGVGSTIGRVPS